MRQGCCHAPAALCGPAGRSRQSPRSTRRRRSRLRWCGCTPQPPASPGEQGLPSRRPLQWPPLAEQAPCCAPALLQQQFKGLVGAPPASPPARRPPSQPPSQPPTTTATTTAAATRPHLRHRLLRQRGDDARLRLRLKHHLHAAVGGVVRVVGAVAQLAVLRAPRRPQLAVAQPHREVHAAPHLAALGHQRLRVCVWVGG